MSQRCKFSFSRIVRKEKNSKKRIKEERWIDETLFQCTVERTECGCYVRSCPRHVAFKFSTLLTNLTYACVCVSVSVCVREHVLVASEWWCNNPPFHEQLNHYLHELVRREEVVCGADGHRTYVTLLASKLFRSYTEMRVYQRPGFQR